MTVASRIVEPISNERCLACLVVCARAREIRSAVRDHPARAMCGCSHPSVLSPGSLLAPSIPPHLTARRVDFRSAGPACCQSSPGQSFPVADLLLRSHHSDPLRATRQNSRTVDAVRGWQPISSTRASSDATCCSVAGSLLEHCRASSSERTALAAVRAGRRAAAYTDEGALVCSFARHSPDRPLISCRSKIGYSPRYPGEIPGRMARFGRTQHRVDEGSR
jgi:hypothetical protein